MCHETLCLTYTYLAIILVSRACGYPEPYQPYSVPDEAVLGNEYLYKKSMVSLNRYMRNIYDFVFYQLALEKPLK